MILYTITPTKPGIPPLHKHGAFDDIDEALNRIRLAASALSGLGSLLEPEHTRADEQLNMALRSQASAVFEFFGLILTENREIAVEAVSRLHFDIEHSIQGDQPC
ncbi:hypothetical protein OYT1_ch1641 [Ferriphaselus amnicola]|uniref:Uncharacterized protein n=1 Tax=Ferriphaselus amnicola TaxID=1188319 RepID=A0A2Z6GCM1_9PROT|nr:hypothetical protein [Ferriphaselus amnicola]BBE51187.1 hypothetical protein OYT1_ch1641 [Ferriphaselus amnicola]